MVSGAAAAAPLHRMQSLSRRVGSVVHPLLRLIRQQRIALVAHQTFPQHLVEFLWGHAVGIGEVKAGRRFRPVCSVVLRFDVCTARVLYAQAASYQRKLSRLQDC